jgi:hypothetical protein
VPSYLNISQFAVDARFARGYNVRLCAKAKGVLESELAFEKLLGGLLFTFLPAIASAELAGVGEGGETMYSQEDPQFSASALLLLIGWFWGF